MHIGRRPDPDESKNRKGIPIEELDFDLARNADFSEFRNLGEKLGAPLCGAEPLSARIAWLYMPASLVWFLLCVVLAQAAVYPVAPGRLLMPKAICPFQTVDVEGKTYTVSRSNTVFLSKGNVLKWHKGESAESFARRIKAAALGAPPTPTTNTAPTPDASVLVLAQVPLQEPLRHLRSIAMSRVYACSSTP